MAATITKTIGATGRDYATIQLWAAAIPANLVTADEVWKGVCYNDGVFDMTTGIAFTNTTDATRYIWITSATGSTPDGKKYSTSAVRLEQGSGHTGYIFSSGDVSLYLLIENLQLKPYGGNNITVSSGNPSNVTLRNCIFYNPDWGSSNNTAIDFHATGDTAYNNLIYGLWTYGVLSYRATFYNNTIHGCETNGMNSPSVNIVAKNNMCIGNAVDYGGTYYTSSNNNLSSDATAPGTSPQINKTAANQVISLTAGSEDFELKAGGSAIGNGADLSGTFTTDIVGTTRTAPWDIGAWKYTASGPAIPVFAEEIEEEY